MVSNICHINLCIESCKIRYIFRVCPICMKIRTSLIVFIFTFYCQIRCIALRILQTSEGFWVFLFRQSSEWGQGYANHNTTRSQTASPACDSNETGKRNLRIRHYIKLKNFALLPAATSFCTWTARMWETWELRKTRR